jgi:thioesterase domain-containing protein
MRNDFFEKFNNPIIPIRKKGKENRIFFVHALSGVGFEYYSLSSYLNQYDLYAINDPTVGVESISFTSISEMASVYIKFLKNIQKEGPYILAGWSFGGLVAYEMALQLNKQNEIAKVIFIDTPCLQKHPSSINPDKVKDYIIEKGINENSESFKKLYPRMMHNAKIAENYTPLYNANIDLFLLKALENFPDGRYTFTDDPSNGWPPNFLKKNHILPIKGNHLSLFDPENVQDCADKLQFVLNNRNTFHLLAN